MMLLFYINIFFFSDTKYYDYHYIAKNVITRLSIKILNKKGDYLTTIQSLILNFFKKCSNFRLVCSKCPSNQHKSVLSHILLFSWKQGNMREDYQFCYMGDSLHWSMIDDISSSGKYIKKNNKKIIKIIKFFFYKKLNAYALIR